MLERILVPLDGSPAAESALVQVRRLLRLRDVEVTLLRVVEYDATQHAEAAAYLERVQAHLEPDGVRVARLLVSEAPVADGILEAARRERSTLIAMGTHGRSGVARWIYGSVAEKVLRASATPVLVVRTLDPAVERPFRHILFPVDGSEPSRRVMRDVMELARPLDARVTLLHVIDEMWSDWAMRDATNDFAKAGLAAAAETRRGDPADSILNAAIDLRADLIVMPTHGCRGVSRWVFGSVTEKVVRGTSVPLLVVRAR